MVDHGVNYRAWRFRDKATNPQETKRTFPILSCKRLNPRAPLKTLILRLASSRPPLQEVPSLCPRRIDTGVSSHNAVASFRFNTQSFISTLKLSSRGVQISRSPLRCRLLTSSRLRESMEPPKGSFASPLADAEYGSPTMPESSMLYSYLYGGMNGWTAALTVLLLLVAYDQCERPPSHCCYQCVLTHLVQYIFKKGTIAGPAWKMPFIGPFLESVNPKFEQYKAKWASGELSCVSVFHKYVFRMSVRVSKY